MARRAVVEAVTREEIVLQHDLAGKVALVTGGSRGIGAAVARALAGAGADVALTYLNSRQAAEIVAGELRAKGVRARSIRADQADPAAAAAVVRQVFDEFGRLDILVNNAAVAVLGPVNSPAPARAVTASPYRMVTVRPVLLAWLPVMIPSGSGTMARRRGMQPSRRTGGGWCA